VTGQFLEVLDLADLLHLIDDPIQNRLDLLVRLFLEERPLAFQSTLMAKEFFLIEGRDLSFSTLCDSHEGRTITPDHVSLQASF
jgi:hypothetical protein